MLGLLTRAMAAVSALLFVAFIIGIASAWARGLEIDCGCFGGGGQLDGASAKYPGEIARDVGLLLAVAVARRTAADPMVAGLAASPRPARGT